MSLRDKLRISGSENQQVKEMLFMKYGIVENPFPSAGQPFGHPHLRSNIDDEIDDRIVEFERYGQNTQVLLITGTQGVGKTNLLNYYQRELEELHEEDKGYYIIRYYPDPEPSFDSIIRRVIQELGQNHLRIMADRLHDLPMSKRSAVVDTARSNEARSVMHSLAEASEKGQGQRDETCGLALEWLVGLRVLNRHRDGLGVYFRLDTVESKTQALRDLIYVSVRLGALRGIFLLLDELEKQDYSLSKTLVIRYLSAIRALIDSLPNYLFLMIALTPEARRRYFVMLPAIAGRLQNTYDLAPLKSRNEAQELYELYLREARLRARSGLVKRSIVPGNESLIEDDDISAIFRTMFEKSAEIGIEGVTQRDFLNELHNRAQNEFGSPLSS